MNKELQELYANNLIPTRAHNPQLKEYAFTNVAWALRSPGDQIHSYSVKVARKYGERGAIVLGYLCEQFRRYEAAGQKLVYKETMDSIARRFPFFPVVAGYAIFAKLKGTALNYEKSTNAYGTLTTCFNLLDKSLLQDTLEDRVFFSAQDAAEYGVGQAVLLLKLTFWIAENRVLLETDYKWHLFPISTVGQELGCRKTTLATRIQGMVKARAIETKKDKDGSSQSYSLVDETRVPILVERLKGVALTIRTDYDFR